ncbi:hypothetical protein [Paractinoplanes globisporus]|uniref:Cell wall-active antibiotics response LiaF-like C-terminal domain-containing protein n=1 Tax=Paractinoplanes globisporus TaxID=113565 RepID=A0ABW6WGY7_9ACTN|nr:hypothetical protein [Actinoplanes globisporus]
MGLLATIVASTWIAGGVDALARIGVALVTALPWVAAVAGIGLLLRSSIPSGLRAGPLVLLIGGIVVIALDSGLLRASWFQGVIPPLVLVGGALLVMRPDDQRSTEYEVVRTLRSIMWPVSWQTKDVAPAKLVLLSVLGEIKVDLGAARFPQGEDDLNVDVTLLGGRIEIVVPHGWHVQAGRVELSRRVTFLGAVSDARPPDADESAERRIVLNVQGWGGVLTVNQLPAPSREGRTRRRTKSAAPDSSRDGRRNSQT